MMSRIPEWCVKANEALFRRQMTHKELGKKLHIHQSKLSLVLKGRLIDDKAIQAITEELNIDVPYRPAFDLDELNL